MGVNKNKICQTKRNERETKMKTKKFLLMIVVVMCSIKGFGQVNVSGDAAYYSKNLSTFTGLMFSEDPAMVSHLNITLDTMNFRLSAAYSGQHAIHHLKDGDRFNLLDLSVCYNVNEELGLSAGYELTYADNIEKDEIGHGVFAMARYSHNNVNSILIYFSDPKMVNRYYIGSVDVEVMKNVSLYTLAGYTNTKDTPLYGLIGLKYKKGGFFAGTYWVFDKDNPGPVCSVGISF